MPHQDVLGGQLVDRLAQVPMETPKRSARSFSGGIASPCFHSPCASAASTACLTCAYKGLPSGTVDDRLVFMGASQ